MGPTIMTISTISIATRHYIIPPTLSLSLFSLSPFSLKNRFYYCLSFLLILSYLLLLSIYSPYFLGAFVYVMEPSLGLLGGGGGGGKEVEAELELGLGLSLGNGGGAAEKEKGKSCAWGEYGRILTAKDFPNGFACGRAAGGGTKRERGAADAVDEGSASAAVSQVVGWPPIRSYRMNTLFNHAKASNAVEEKGVGEDESSKKKINHGGDKHDAAMAIKERGHLGFVKVNMDGLPIGRKVDLNAHKSYQTLANALEEMFFNPSLSTRGAKEQVVQPLKLLDGSSEFVLTYEDKEGDWMLVGDVPWGMFLNTVKRLRIMRTSEANGLAPKSQERNEKQKSKLI